MKEKFVDHRFSDESLDIIQKCNDVLRNYSAQGYTLSLRQLYYQLVSKDYIPNTVKSYKRVGGIVSDARLAGLMDWSMIEDRNRESEYLSHWDTPAEILETAAASFRLDMWVGQENYIEVMVEKDALSGILIPVCQKYDLRFTANKGYSSSSAMYEASLRLRHFYKNETKNLHIIYLGDHDPSGIDMTRDIEDRFQLFTCGLPVEIHRLALNFDQVQMWNPPENPAKESDSRFEDYQKKFGDSSWELDAVEPRNLVSIVSDEIVSLIDLEVWSERKRLQTKYVETLHDMAANFKEDHTDDDGEDMYDDE